MARRLAPLVIVFGAGCSIIYNPNNIKQGSGDGGMIDSPVDAEMITDVNPAALHLESLFPPQLYEGQGAGGSRPCLLVIQGEQIQDAVIAVAPATANANVTLTLGTQMVSPDHDWVATEISAAVMETVNEGSANDVPLTVTVTQTGAPMPLTLPWTLTALDQLESMAAGAVSVPVPTVGKLYSKVSYPTTSTVTFTGTARAVVVSMSSITMGTIHASAAAAVGGPGGCAGGAAQSSGGCYGGGGGGASGGGGGAGFASAGTVGGGSSGVGAAGPASGDALIATYDGHPGGALNANTPSGGGGGANGLGTGGAGGGGGGIVELTAGGDVSIGALSANGAAGTAGGSIGVGPGGGGGGAGGALVLRSGGALTVTGALSAQGGGAGAAGGGGQAGGGGAAGRIRYDVATAPTLAAGSMPTPYRGMMFVAPPTITTTQRPMLSLVGSPNDSYTVIVHDQHGNQQSTVTGRALSASGTDTFALVLTAGDNEVCVIVANGIYTDPEARNCVHIALLPGMP